MLNSLSTKPALQMCSANAKSAANLAWILVGLHGAGQGGSFQWSRILTQHQWHYIFKSWRSSTFYNFQNIWTDITWHLLSVLGNSTDIPKHKYKNIKSLLHFKRSLDNSLIWYPMSSLIWYPIVWPTGYHLGFQNILSSCWCLLPLVKVLHISKTTLLQNTVAKTKSFSS